MTPDAEQGTCQAKADPATTCGRPARWRYRSMTGIWVRLCDQHGESSWVDQVWSGRAWVKIVNGRPPDGVAPPPAA